MAARLQRHTVIDRGDLAGERLAVDTGTRARSRLRRSRRRARRHSAAADVVLPIPISPSATAGSIPGSTAIIP